MQLSSQNNDLIEFKGEIYKKLHSLENKFLSEFNSKLTQINSNFDKIDIKLNTVNQNNNSLLDLVSKQNFNFEKVNQFDTFKSKTDQTLITQQIQIKNIIQEMHQMKDNYEKIVSENLTIPGCIGPGSKYKNLGDYLIYEMNEFHKLRNETEQNKKKVGDWEKTAVNIISNSLFRFQSLLDNKNNQMHILFDKKFGTFNSKILDLETQLEKYQFKIDKLTKSFQDEIQIMVTSSNKYNENIDQKFEEINQRINSLIQDFESQKGLKFKDENKENNNFLINSPNHENKGHNSNKNINIVKRNIGASNFKIQPQESKKSNNASNKDDEQKNSSIIFINNNNDNFSQIFSDDGSPIRKDNTSQIINNESKKNQEEKTMPTLPEKLAKDSINKEENNHNNQPDVTIQIRDKAKNGKSKNENGSNIISKDNDIAKENEKIKKYIDKTTNVDNYSHKNLKPTREIKNMYTNNIIINKGQSHISNNNIIIGKVQSIISNNNNSKTNNNDVGGYNNNNILSNKIIINSIKKQNVENKNNNLALNEYELNLAKSENKIETIKSLKINKMNLNKKQESKESINNEIIIITNKYNSKSSETIQNKTKEDINNEQNNKENINLKAFITPKNYLTSNKENKGIFDPPPICMKLKLQMNMNFEQQKIMTKIREYYYNRKKLAEKKSKEKIVDCNIINLNLRNSSRNNRYSSHSTPRNTFYTSSHSKMNKPGNFGRTNEFYSHREKYSRARSLNSSEN